MIILVFLITLYIEIWYTLRPTLVLWDTAMYIGIGKYIFSHGALGLFESFRPPLLPIIFGALWKIGFDPMIAGQVLAIIFSLVTLLVVYLIGRRISKAAGTISALLLGFSAVYIAFSTPPLSDVPSVLFSLCAVFFALRKKYWLTGISVALAFYTRFPAALIVVPIGFFYLLDQEVPQFKQKVFAVLKTAGGFLIPLLPYFIVNQYYFHNPFAPILIANRVASDPLNAHGQDAFFYISRLLTENPFLIFSLLILIPIFIAGRKLWNAYVHHAPTKMLESERTSLLVFLSLLIVGAYFNFNSHLELRYSIAFLPYLTLAAGYGFHAMLKQIAERRRKAAYLFVALFLMASLTYINWYAYKTMWPFFEASPDIQQFMEYFKDKPNATVITAVPQAISYSDIKIIQAIDTWESADRAYGESNHAADYFVLDDCAMVCASDTTCAAATSSLYTKLNRDHTRVYDVMAASNTCHLEIYKKN